MKRAGWFSGVVLLGGAVVFFARRPDEKAAVPEVSRKEEEARVFPKLREARVGTVGNPLQSWERLLARDGSPAEDRAALADLVTNYVQASPVDRRPALGANEEFARALTDMEALGDAALPADHPAIVNGKLVDRWGNPWFFHQESADVIEVRSAGADGRLFTADDVTR